ncbi:MAG: hypothetical protein ACMXX7_01760 [Candidatus Woesearchaeota archaeon]
MGFPNHISNYLTDKEIKIDSYDSFFKEKEYTGFRTFFLKTLSACIDRTRGINNSLGFLIDMDLFKDEKSLAAAKEEYDKSFKRLNIIFEELKTDQLKESMQFFVKDTIKYLNKLSYLNNKLGDNFIIAIKKIVKNHFDLEKKEIHDELLKVDKDVDSIDNDELLKKRFNEHFVSIYVNKRKELESEVDPFLASLPEMVGSHAKANYIKGFKDLLEKVKNNFENYDYFEAYKHIKNLGNDVNE